MKRSKPLVLALCAVLLAVGTILGTVAYLQDTASVVNTFTVGNVHLKLDEAVVDEKGEPTGGRTETGNAYHLLPGETYTKDPTVTVKKGTEGAYVRLLVTVSGFGTVKEVFGSGFLPENFVEGWDKEKWVYSGATEFPAENTVTYEFRYYKTVSATEEDVKLEPLFKKLLLPGDSVDLEGVKKLAAAGVSVSVTGHGIQSAGFENADEAWAAFAEQVK